MVMKAMNDTDLKGLLSFGRMVDYEFPRNGKTKIFGTIF